MSSVFNTKLAIYLWVKFNGEGQFLLNYSTDGLIEHLIIQKSKTIKWKITVIMNISFLCLKKFTQKQQCK